jgi:hypothetical protein
MRDRGLATAVATLLAAFATAHLMQFGLSAGRLVSGDPEAAPIGLATFVAGQAEAPPSELPPEPATLPATAAAVKPLPLPPARGVPRDAGVPGAVGRGAGNGLGQSCERTLAVAADAGAMLRVEVRAPCDPGVRVEIGHAGLRFAVETAGDGRIGAAVPAMAPDALVVARFEDGTTLRARAAVPEAARRERVAVVSEGWAALALHAYEFGARRGGAGHVHAGADQAGAGTLHRLGDAGIGAPLLSEVYTMPSGRLGSLGAVRLEVEAMVTPANCARDLAAEVVRSAGRTDLRLSMPSCEAAGDLLAIALPPGELRIAVK